MENLSPCRQPDRQHFQIALTKFALLHAIVLAAVVFLWGSVFTDLPLWSEQSALPAVDIIVPIFFLIVRAPLDFCLVSH